MPAASAPTSSRRCATALLGTTVPALVAQSACDAAQKHLKQPEMLGLSQSEMIAFMRALKRPLKPTAALKRLMRPI